MISKDQGSLTILALELLPKVRRLFDDAVKTAAVRFSINGQLDAELLDQNQFVCYELAMAAAELLSAEASAVDSASMTALDSKLALAFITDAIVTVLSKLDGLALELDLDDGARQSIATGAELHTLRAGAISNTALTQIGKGIAESGGDFGSVVLEESVAMAQDAFSRFAQEVIAPRAEAIHRHDETVPEELLQPMREMGVFGLSIPEQYGGSAVGEDENALMMIAVTEALSAASLAAAGSLITRPEILARALMAGGTESQKARWLPGIAVGEPLCGIAITEPDYGSDVANLSLRATRVDGGWRLNGAKTWCTFAGKAGLLMVVARTNPDRKAGHRGLSVMLVEKPSYADHSFEYIPDSGGKLIGRAIPTIGYRGMHSFDLTFENLFVPDANVVGEEGGLGKGFYLTMAGMVGGRMQTAARAAGVMRAALTAALRYAGDRKVFGKALIEYPLTQVKLARMASRFVACRRLTYIVGRRISTPEGRMQASLVKLLACRAAEGITRDAMQIHGGMGYAEESAVSRYFVDARVLSIFEGAEETLALKVIAKSLLESALESKHE